MKDNDGLLRLESVLTSPKSIIRIDNPGVIKTATRSIGEQKKILTHNIRLDAQKLTWSSVRDGKQREFIFDSIGSAIVWWNNLIAQRVALK